MIVYDICDRKVNKYSVYLKLQMDLQIVNYP